MTITPIDTSDVPFDPSALLGVLVAHDVDFVLIGGLAAIAHGYDRATGDVDATPRNDPANLARLVRALHALDARLLVPVNERQEATIDVPIDERTFTSLTSARFVTAHGVLDIVLRPDGVASHQEWVASAVDVTMPGPIVVKVGALDLIIRSKEAANRPKDRDALPRLRALRDLIDERAGRSADPA